MLLSNPTKLHVLFWEIKNRLFYIFLSFSLSFIIAYQNAKSLLYIFVLSYGSNARLGYFPSSTVEELSLKKDEGVALLSLDLASINFIFTDVEEAFSYLVFISVIFSVICVIPLLVYESFSFFSASLYFYESKKWFFRVFLIAFFWCLFVYIVQNFLIPRLAEFLLFFKISSPAFSLSAETKISSYCSWVTHIWIVTHFVFFFLVWLVGFVLSRLNASRFRLEQEKKGGLSFKIQSLSFYPSSKPHWVWQRKVNAVGSVLISAFIAPPEAIQFVLALFFFFTAEVSLCVYKIANHFILRKKSF